MQNVLHTGMFVCALKGLRLRDIHILYVVLKAHMCLCICAHPCAPGGGVPMQARPCIDLGLPQDAMWPICLSPPSLRVDPIIAAARKSGVSASDASIKSRERVLLPLYSRIARTFADMHDTPVRMLAKVSCMHACICLWCACMHVYVCALGLISRCFAADGIAVCSACA